MDYNYSQYCIDGPIITLGTDIEKKFAWCIREISGQKYVVLYNRDDGWSTFGSSDFITAMPLDTIIKYSIKEF